MTQRIVDVGMDGSILGSGPASIATVTKEQTLPEKFQGKSVDEIVEMYSNLEKEHGRQGNEMGELRRLADKLIQSNVQTSNAPAATEEDKALSSEEFLEDPVKAVKDIVMEATQKTEAAVEEARKEANLTALRQKHPDMLDVVKDQAFQDWVLEKASRQLAWGEASQGNFDIADELFTEWAAKNKKPDADENDPNVQAATAQRSRELAAATTVSAGSSTDSLDGSGQKPVFARADLIRLQIEDPMRYKQLSPQIMQAYQEGRVV